MISGYDVYRQFSSIRDDVERDRRNISEKILGLQGEVDKLLREQSGLFKKLAAFHVSAGVALPATVEQALDERKAKVASKKEEVGERTRLISVSKKQVAILDEKINALTAEIESEEAAIRERFMADERVKPIYVDLAAASQAHGDMNRALQAANEELAEKRLAFEKDELFVYLHKRKFGTPDYKGSLLPITRMLDRRLANSFNYVVQAADYDFLVARPGMIEDRIAARKPEHEKLQAQYDVLEAEYFDVTKPKRDELETLKEQRQQAIDSGKSHADALATINQFLADAALAEDADLKSIISNFADLLAKPDFQSKMRAMAEQTPSTEDDATVSRIQAIASEVATRDSQIDDEKRNLSSCESKLEGLRRIESEIDHNNWHATGHTFSGVNVGTLADAFLRDMMTDASVIGQLNDAHRDPPRPRPTPSSGDFGGGFGGSSSSSSSGGFGGFDDSSTTSSFGGSSSHTTTGGFGGD
ncbi:hypothetical protein ACU8NH_15500 [Rhizobium leguminosarum]|uniref:hypothetical protein n=1 Tax=Rhizobium TaxID=379 RepID=UPI001030C2B7|nr:hypothetical protein [Rhizobium leguminosarum]MDH6657398.1 chromosome segregation ATPase [Rhizobium sophorae]QIO74793.1 hypothetical protein HA459_23375 [Rhizobium leguminosarum bv. trifolii]QIO81814.1 hypothetical protein HA460_23415 [Rhizobium leguminosarum bv. trifolii]TAV12110.1 hypothetical protein ELI37_17175 [Rhizobium leguminosarum]TAX51825.1 hypothetical protein ELH99_17415 [Rhizobium leguminosarum]